MGKKENVALITSGGLAPCLASSVAWLIHYWKEALNAGKIDGLTIRCYRDGYKGVLVGNSYLLTEEQMDQCDFLHNIGGSPIGNSRVKLTNDKDCLRREFIQEGKTAIEVAARRLMEDNVTVLHTIGGDDTNTQAAELSEYILNNYGGTVTVVGMPKTIDNDVIPIVQTLGADTAADQGALFFENIVSESSSNPRMLILHECMGRASGFLTAMTAKKYRERLMAVTFPADNPFDVTFKSRDVHAVWIPEQPLDIVAEGARLRDIMDKIGCVNVFLSEGCGTTEIIAKMETKGEKVPHDPHGHVTLAKIDPGAYFGTRLAVLVNSEKTLVQKSGYFARSAKSNDFDRTLIGKFAELAVQSAIDGVSGCMGQDEDMEGTPLRAIEFGRIRGGKTFDASTPWFQTMLHEIGQITE